MFIGMSKLPHDKRVQILSLLCEGASMRSTSRLADVSINTVTKLLAEAGRAAASYHDTRVRGLRSKRVQVDEIWSFCAAKQKNVASMKTPIAGAGDCWTWTSLDADSKLIVSFLVGSRDAECAHIFMHDVASRIDRRVQVTSDGLKVYIEAVDDAFNGFVDYAMLVKSYGDSDGPASPKGRYSPAECTGAKKVWIQGMPDVDHVSTSYVERQNLTMRMHMRRFTRLTNAFSKRVEAHTCMVALYTYWYNWVRIHKSLRTTPAMAAGLTDKLVGFDELLVLMDATAPKVGRPIGSKTKQAVITLE